MNKRLKIGIVALAVVVFLVVGSYIGGLLNPDNSGGLGLPSSKYGSFAVEGDVAEAVVERGSILPPEPGYGTIPTSGPILDRKIIRDAYLGIKVDDFKASFQKVINVAEDVGGFVTSSSSNIDDRDIERGDIQIRIPGDKFTETLNLLENVGEVRSRNIIGNDITEEYLDLESQLSNLKKEEKRLLEILEKAETVEDILNVERELSRVRTQIDYNTGRLNFLNDRAEFATININLFEEQLIEEGGLLDTIKDSLNLFVRSIKNLLLFVGAVLPYAVIIFFVWVAVKLARKIRKKTKKN